MLQRKFDLQTPASIKTVYKTKYPNFAGQVRLDVHVGKSPLNMENLQVPIGQPIASYKKEGEKKLCYYRI